MVTESSTIKDGAPVISAESCTAFDRVCGGCFGGCHSSGRYLPESDALSLGESSSGSVGLGLQIVSCFCQLYVAPLIAMFAFALAGEGLAKLAAIPSVDAISTGAGLLGFMFYLRVVVRLPLINGHK